MMKMMKRCIVVWLTEEKHEHCQRSSASQISDTAQIGFEPCTEPEFMLR